MRLNPDGKCKDNTAKHPFFPRGIRCFGRIARKSKGDSEMDEKMNARSSLAMARVAWQMWEGTLSPADALKRGTAFSALYMPFLGKEARA